MTKTSRSLRIYVSLFFLPMALLYALTGALFVLGVDDGFGAKTEHYTLEKQLNAGQESEAMLAFVREKGLQMPKNQPTDTKDDTALASLGTLPYSTQINQVAPATYEITTLKRSFFGVLMGLHETKDSSLFDLLAIGFALTLLALYATGIIITLLAMNKSEHKSQYLALFSGFVVCIFVDSLKVFWGI